MIQRGGCGWPKMRRVTMSAPALPKQRLGRRRLAVVLGGMGLEVERVFVLASGAVVGAENQQGDGAVLAPGEQHRHLVAVLQRVIVGVVPVAQGVEKLGEPPALALDPLLVPALVRELAAELQVVAGEGSQRLVRGSGPGACAAPPLRPHRANGRRCLGCPR